MRKLDEHSVSEVVGTVLLILLTISSFAVIYVTVLSDHGPTPNTIVNIVATVEGKNIILEHRGGESIASDTLIKYSLNETDYQFLLADGLEARANINEQWDLGERCYIPFDYDIDYLERYDKVELSVAEELTNSLIFMGSVELNPMCDIGLVVNYEPELPEIDESVTITVVATCLGGDVGARNIEISCLLPNGLNHNWNTTTGNSRYSNKTGIWSIEKMEIGDSVTLQVNATVTIIEVRSFTQIAVILDGSGSISSSDWNTMRTGLGNAVENETVFPRDNSVELSVVQFGGDYNPPTVYPKAMTTIDQTIISNDGMDPGYYQTVSNTIKTMSQLGGGTPTASGIRLAADKIHDSSRFNPSNRSVVILVTDGKANCEWVSGGYESTWDGNGWTKSSFSHNGSYSAYASPSGDGTFISKDIDTSNVSVFSIDFWYYLDDTQYEDDLYLYYFDGEHYDPIEILADDTEDKWLHYTDQMTSPADSQYFHEHFNIKFYSRVESGERVWIDDITIHSTDVMFVDGFESSDWNKFWTDPGKISANNARQYLLERLSMTEEQDEFDCLSVGSNTDEFWLNHSITWPQPGYEAPPYDKGSGWWSHIDGYTEFETAITNIFKTIFQSRVTPITIQLVEPFDPNNNNDDYSVTIVPSN